MKNPGVILITGASSGIGAALALAYAQKGVKLLLTGRDENRLAAVEKSCRAQGAAVKTALLDVTDRSLCERQIAIWDDMEPIDLLIANAGISGGMSGDADLITRTNINGILHTMTPLLPRMRARKKGQIAIMSSMAGQFAMPNAPIYSASKVWARALGEALRPVLKTDHISVSVIMPGFVRSRLTDANNFDMPFLMEADKAARIIKKGLAQNKAHIAFPWQMHLIIRVLGFLPYPLRNFILMRRPKK